MVFNVLFLFHIATADVDFLQEPITPLPLKAPAESAAKVELGRRLFNEKQLSKTNSVSCSSCHDLKSGGADHRDFSVGINDSLGGVNSPTVFNSPYNFVLFWDGRARTLEEQVDGPIKHPKEMGATWADVIRKLKEIPEYVRMFAKVFPGGITEDNVKSAITAFERQLITPNSKFDQYLRGDYAALNEKELQGYRNFKSYGCIACHQGANVGGNMFQTMGIMGNYFKDRGTPLTQDDMGRYNVTAQESDRHVFRVPSLRNIALTAPYFHDGSAATLERAVEVMAKYQLGRRIPAKDRDRIVDFLKTLTGETPAIVREPAQEKKP